MTALGSHEIFDCGIGTDVFDDAGLSKPQRIVSGADQSWHQKYPSFKAAFSAVNFWAACEWPSSFAVFLSLIPSQHHMSLRRLPDNSGKYSASSLAVRYRKKRQKPYRGNISASSIFIESFVVKNQCIPCLPTDSPSICSSLWLGGYDTARRQRTRTLTTVYALKAAPAASFVR